MRRKEEEEVEDGTKLAAADGHPPLYIPPPTRITRSVFCILHSAHVLDPHQHQHPVLFGWFGNRIVLCNPHRHHHHLHLLVRICIICPVRVRISCPRAPRATAHTFVVQTPGVLR